MARFERLVSTSQRSFEASDIFAGRCSLSQLSFERSAPPAQLLELGLEAAAPRGVAVSSKARFPAGRWRETS